MADKILVVEDDLNLLATLRYNLKKEGYDVVTAADGAEALEAARREKPALLILDVMLPKLSGLEVCRILRSEMPVPILMLTAKADETDKIIGLGIGADDYMTKPFSVRELLARVAAMLRRVKMVQQPADEKDSVLKYQDIEIDPASHTVKIKGKATDMNPKEFDLLTFFIKNKGLVLSREQILQKVWGYEYAGDTCTVDVHVRWLREKIEAEPQSPKLLLTVHGIGYKMEGK
ncbi:MAG: response regulator transcription factor [Dehalococcoidales bacterium]|nr:response regulator transcription factor [Dehalococcoidales bacterium]